LPKSAKPHQKLIGVLAPIRKSIAIRRVRGLNSAKVEERKNCTRRDGGNMNC
jgi:hypothetical protein